MRYVSKDVSGVLFSSRSHSIFVAYPPSMLGVTACVMVLPIWNSNDCV